MDDLSLYRFRIGCFASIAYKKFTSSRKRKLQVKSKSTLKCRKKTIKTPTSAQKNINNEHKHSCRLALLILVIIIIPITSLNKPKSSNSFDAFPSDFLESCVPKWNKDFRGIYITMHQNEINYTRSTTNKVEKTLLIKEHCNVKQVLDNATYNLENINTYCINDVLTDTDLSFLNTTFHNAKGNKEWPQRHMSRTVDSLSIDAVSTIIMILIGTCYYLLGNKGAHCYNGNPREKAGDAWLTESTLSLIKARADESVGYISIKTVLPYDSDDDITYKDTGTGFRAGDKYFITAYHVLKETIDQTLEDLCLRFEDHDVLDPIMIRLGEALNKKEVQKGVSIADVHKMLKLFTHKTATNISKLLNLLDGICDADKIDEWFANRQRNKCLVSFIKHGDFYVDWKIAFGDEQSDIVIVQLVESVAGQTFPRPLLLDENYRQLTDIHILRYIKGNTSKVIIDQDTNVFGDDTSFKKQVDEAIQWWHNTFPGENDNYFSDLYASCKTRYEEKTGRVIFKASKAFKHGASGSPIVYLFNSDGQPVVEMIYQRGLPEFYYCAQDRNGEKYVQFKGIKVDSTKCLFESGTTMKRLAEVLKKSGQNDLKCNIFSQPLRPQYQCVSFEEIQQIKKEVLELKAEIRKANDPRSRVNPNINKLNSMINKSRQQVKYEMSENSDEPRYIKTGAYYAAEKILKKSNIIVIIGNPGDGKTALAYQLMKSLTQNENHKNLQPLILPDANLFDDLIEPNNALCVLLDDMLGSCCAELNKYFYWISRLGMLSSTFRHGNDGQENILIVTTRTDVLNDCPLSIKNSRVFKKNNTVDMSSKCYLNNECMRDILKAHLPALSEGMGEKILEKLEQYSPSFGFPQCCNLLGSMDQPSLNPEQIFQNPMKFLLNELKKLEEQLRDKGDGKFKYYSLLILLLHPTYFTSETPSHTEIEVIDCLQRIYGLECVGKEKVTHTLRSMRGLYVEYNINSNEFRFSHESVHTAVAFAFGSKFTKYFIQFCDTQQLSSLVIDEESNSPNDKIKVPKCVLTFLQKKVCEHMITKDEKAFKNIANMPIWMNHGFLTNMMKMDERPLSTFHTDTTGRSLFVYLVEKGRTSVIQKIITNIHNHCETQLRLAINAACINGHYDIFDTLINVCTEPDIHYLMNAVKGRNTQILSFLLDRFPTLGYQKVSAQLYSFCLPYDITILHQACFEGNIQLVSLICSKLPDLAYVPDDSGMTPLHVSCFEGHLEVTEYLVNKYPKLLHEKYDGWLPIHEAAQSGNIRCYDFIERFVMKDYPDIKSYVTAAVTDSGLSVFNTACLSGNEKMCRHIYNKYPYMIGQKNCTSPFLSLACSGDVDCFQTVSNLCISPTDEEEKHRMMTSVDYLGNSILHQACGMGKTEMCKYISKTYPNLINIKTYNGNHVLHKTAMSGNIECLKHMTDIVVENKDLEYRKQYMMECLNKSGCTILHLACRGGKTEMCQYIVEKYPNLVNVNDNNGKGILHEVAFSGNIECLENMTDIVVKNKDLEYRKQYIMGYLDKSGCTILHLACRGGQIEICQYLVEKHPNLVNVNDNNGEGVLHEAAFSGNIECLKHMTDIVVVNKDPEYRAKYMTEYVDKSGRTILCGACRGGKTKMCQYIVEKYPNLVNVNDNNGHGVLHETAFSGNIECLKHMTDIVVKNNNLEYRKQYMMGYLDKSGCTILNLACRGVNTEMCQYIVENYPDLINVKRNDGIGVLHETAFAGGIDCLKHMTDIIVKNKDLEYRKQYMMGYLDKFGCTILHVACRGGETEMCQYIVENYPDLVNVKRNDGQGALHETAFSGNIECLKHMTDIVVKNKDLEYRKQYMMVYLDKSGCTILHAACFGGKTEMCQYIIENYPDLINVKNNDRQGVLHETAFSGNIECLKHMTDIVIKNKDLEYRKHYVMGYLDKSGCTILHEACRGGKTEMCQYIAEKYPNLLSVNDNNGEGVLHQATSSGNIECLKHMTDIVVENKDLEYRKQYMMKCLNKSGCTILYLACRGGKTEMCQYIVEKYPNLVNVNNNSGKGVLHGAAFSGNLECLKHMTDIVVENKDLEYRKQYMMGYLDKSGCTILHLACSGGKTEVCQYIVENYPDLINVKRNDGIGVLHETAFAGGIDCLKHMTDIIVKNKDLEYRKQYMMEYLDKFGCTILHVACRGGKTEMCQYIVENYPDLVNVKRNDGQGALHETAFSGNIDCLKHITDIAVNNKDPEYRQQYMTGYLDKFGCTILHSACLSGKPEICQYIFENYPNLVNVNRKYLRHILCQSGVSESIGFLKEIVDKEYMKCLIM